MILNYIIFILFLPAVAGICWMIWNEDKLIAFEQRVKTEVRAFFETVWLLIEHRRQMRHKGEAFRGGV